MVDGVYTDSEDEEKKGLQAKENDHVLVKFTLKQL